jgi:hypothetical protein
LPFRFIETFIFECFKLYHGAPKHIVSAPRAPMVSIGVSAPARCGKHDRIDIDLRNWLDPQDLHSRVPMFGAL